MEQGERTMNLTRKYLTQRRKDAENAENAEEKIRKTYYFLCSTKNIGVKQ